MGIPTHIVDCISTVTALGPENFSEFSPLLLEFFPAAGLSHVIAEDDPGVLNATTQKLDDEFSLILYSKVDPTHRKLIANIKGARARWNKLVTSWTNSTFVDRIITFEELISIVHDPAHHITVFTESIDSLCGELSKRGLDIDDAIKTSILLARLHRSMAATRYSLCAGSTFPKYDEATARLRLDSHHTQVRIKEEEPDVSIAAMFVRVPGPPGGNPPPEAFEHGFRWCSPPSDKDCFRCGRPGHRAQLCMAVMPEPVVQWILRATRSGSSPYVPTLTSPAARDAPKVNARPAFVEEKADDQDYDDWDIPWEILSPEQLKVFLDRNIRPEQPQPTSETVRLTRVVI